VTHSHKSHYFFFVFFFSSFPLPAATDRRHSEPITRSLCFLGVKNLSTHRKDEASCGDNAFLCFFFVSKSLRVNNVVTFSIERHVLLRQFFFLFSDLACFFIFKVIQARLKCTCLVQKKQSKLVVPASQIHVTSVFRNRNFFFSSFFSSTIPAARKRLPFSYNCCFKQPGRLMGHLISMAILANGFLHFHCFLCHL
jgi:hypothetical protein